MSGSDRKKNKTHEPTIEHRRARFEYTIEETLECGIRLTGTEIKSVRMGLISLNEGFVRAHDVPPSLELHAVHIAEYPNAAEAHQHKPTRVRTLLAHKREIIKLAKRTKERGVTLVPLKVYFSGGRAKLLVGVGRGRKQVDKRHAIAEREAKRDIERTRVRKG